MKKFIMICVLSVIVLLILTGSIIFGDKIIQIYENPEKIFGDSNTKNIEKDNKNNGEENTENSGGGSSSGGGGSSSGDILTTNCNTKQVQYSLKNFQKNVICTNSNEEKCFNLIVNCSVEVYNFDGGVGVFGIEYFLIDSEENKLNSELIEKEVSINKPEKFLFYMIKNDPIGFDKNLDCTLIMRTIPLKEFCS